MNGPTEFVTVLLALWAVVSFLWLTKLQTDSSYQIRRIEQEISRLDDDDDAESWKVLNALKAAVKVLEDDE